MKLIRRVRRLEQKQEPCRDLICIQLMELAEDTLYEDLETLERWPSPEAASRAHIRAGYLPPLTLILKKDTA